MDEPNLCKDCNDFQDCTSCVESPNGKPVGIAVKVLLGEEVAICEEQSTQDPQDNCELEMFPSREIDPETGLNFFVCKKCDEINPNPRDDDPLEDELDPTSQQLNPRIDECTYKLEEE